MPRTLPAGLPLQLSQEKQTKRNDADPAIQCKLSLAPGPLTNWNQMKSAKPYTHSEVQGTWGGYHGVSQARSHPMIDSTEHDTTILTFCHNTTGSRTVFGTLTDGGILGPSWEAHGDAAGSWGPLAYLGWLREEQNGDLAYITKAQYPIWFANYARKIYRVWHYGDSGAEQQIGSFDVPNDPQIIRAVIPAKLNGPVPGIYFYYIAVAGGGSTGGLYCTHVGINEMQQPAVMSTTLLIPSTRNARPAAFSASQSIDSDKVILDVYFDDFNSNAVSVVEYISTTDPLTFDSGTDVTADYTATIDGSARVLEPQWLLFHPGGFAQRIASTFVSVIATGQPSTSNPAYYMSTTKAKIDDYDGSQVWSLPAYMAGNEVQYVDTGGGIIRPASVFIDDLHLNTDGSVTCLKHWTDRPYEATATNSPLPIKIWTMWRVLSTQLGDITADGSISSQNDNGIQQLNLTVQNNDIEALTSPDSMFRPGTRVDISLTMGHSDPLEMIAAKIDEVSIDVDANTFTISGRNLTGYQLAAASFQQDTTLTGSCDQMAATIFGMAGIDNFEAMHSDYVFSMTFEAKTTALEALNKIADYFTTDSIVFELVELPSGLIVYGYRGWINANYQATGFYDMNPAKEYKRQIRRNADASFASIVVTGKDANGNDLTPCTATPQNFEAWDIPAAKTYYTEAPGELTQQQLQDYADHLAATMSRTGVTQTFRGQLKPELLVGDVVRDNTTNPPTVLGIVTSVRHKFGAGGYSTEFTVDSGGVVEDGGDITQTKNLSGYTRRQRVTDIMANIADRKN